MDEQDAIRLLQQGEIEGLEELVRRYQTRALRAAALVTGDRAMAEDVVQQAFLRVHERAHQFDLARPFGPWFLRIVTNDAVKATQRGRRVVSLDRLVNQEDVRLADLVPDAGLSPEEMVERAETQEVVWSAVQRLAPAQRAAIVRRYYLGLSDAESAAEGLQGVGAVRQLLHRARRRLAVLLSS